MGCEGFSCLGAVWLFCEAQDPDVGNLSFDSSGVDPVIGTGLNEDGELEAGGTWTVFFSEVLTAVGVALEDQNFIGYCHVVGEFDAIVGTYANVNTLVDPPLLQDFAMQADMEGNDVDLD